mgnify:CR=1 FL=1
MTTSVYDAIVPCGIANRPVTSIERVLGIAPPVRAMGLLVAERLGEQLGDEIRSPAVSQSASKVSSGPEVRAALLELQRSLGRARSSVLEGRDIGTVVFPDADLKIFLTATAEERARRRTMQMKERGEQADYAEILAETAITTALTELVRLHGEDDVVDMMETLIKVFDPDRRLNPGKLLPTGKGCLEVRPMASGGAREMVW